MARFQLMCQGESSHLQTGSELYSDGASCLDRFFVHKRLHQSRHGTVIGAMRVIALSTLKTFWESNPAYSDAIQPVLAWYRHTLKADWASPSAVKQDFKNASIIKDGRVIFNIAGNKYRLVVWINYAYRVVYIRFIDTHAQYDLRASLKIQILSQHFVAHKKCLLTYQSYAASTFFARVSFCLKL